MEGTSVALSVSTACARTLVDEFARAGLTEAVLAPGSRSAPLGAGTGRRRTDPAPRPSRRAIGGVLRPGGGQGVGAADPGAVHVGHRGRPLPPGRAGGRPLPGPADRLHGRPAGELRDTGAPQTTDQIHLYGAAVRFFADLPADGDPAARAAWRPIAARVWAEAAGPPAGPVHLNVAFREPLVPSGPERRPPPLVSSPGGRTGGPGSCRTGLRAAVLAPARRPTSTERILAAERGLVVAGWGSPAEAGEVAARLQWPLLADAISGLRSQAGGTAQQPPKGLQVVTTYEALLRVPAFAESHRPDLVIRFGGPLTSKTAMTWLDASIPQILVDPDGAWLDPQRAAAERVPALPDLGAGSTRDAAASRPHRMAGRLARGRGDRRGARSMPSSTATTTRSRAGSLGTWRRCAPRRRSNPALVVASSMPVRDLEAFAGQAPRRVFANRGVNGIDGLVSTVLGCRRRAMDGRRWSGCSETSPSCTTPEACSERPERGLDAVFVVVDNRGGGIFSFLPQAGLPSERFELLFGTPPEADVGGGGAGLRRARGAGGPGGRCRAGGGAGPDRRGRPGRGRPDRGPHRQRRPAPPGLGGRRRGRRQVG